MVHIVFLHFLQIHVQKKKKRESTFSRPLCYTINQLQLLDRVESWAWSMSTQEFPQPEIWHKKNTFLLGFFFAVMQSLLSYLGVILFCHCKLCIFSFYSAVSSTMMVDFYHDYAMMKKTKQEKYKKFKWNISNLQVPSSGSVVSVCTTGCSRSTGGWTWTTPPYPIHPPSPQVFMSHFTPGQACGEATQLQSYHGDLLTSPYGRCQVFIVNRGEKPQLTKKR